MFQFALDPEEEARQVAQRVTRDGRMRGLVLLPNNEWGQRVFRAFDTELKTLGGAIAGLRFYDPAARDYSEPITQLLLIDESRARANALSAALGTRLEFEPRRRGDAQFVFIGAQPVQGRSLRPALRFISPTILPIYATSDIFEPDAQANNDLEGVIFPDMPWVISPDAVSTELRTALNKSLAGARARARSPVRIRLRRLSHRAAAQGRQVRQRARHSRHDRPAVDRRQGPRAPRARLGTRLGRQAVPLGATTAVVTQPRDGIVQDEHCNGTGSRLMDDRHARKRACGAKPRHSVHLQRCKACS